LVIGDSPPLHILILQSTLFYTLGSTEALDS